MPETKTIYIADDDSDDIEFFTIALEEICSSCNLVVSHDGDELLRILQDSTVPPDIIFLDVNMPRVDGISALALVRNMPYFNAVPVVVYSTSSDRLFISKAYENGANFYLVKPVSFSILKEQIENLLTMNWKNYTLPTGLDEFILK